MNAQKSRPIEKECLNCGTPLTGKYCSNCGQKDLPKRQTLAELFLNFLGSFTSFESKFFKTLRFQLLNPGFLTKEFTQGRRERYFHPARAYVFCSFLFFMILSWSDEEEMVATITDEEADTSFVFNNDSFNAFDTLIEYESKELYDSIQQTISEEKRDSFFKRLLNHRIIDLNKKYRSNGEGLFNELKANFKRNFPKVFFMLLPVFALILMLLYIRRDYYFTEHLVFSTFYYNFFYLNGTIGHLLDKIPYMGWIEPLMYVWIMVGLLFAMKVMYGQSWRKTIFKYFLFFWIFCASVGVAMMVNLIVVTMTQI